MSKQLTIGLSDETLKTSLSKGAVSSRFFKLCL
jgi:hypothetical protein